jgi:hypothetical protein
MGIEPTAKSPEKTTVPTEGGAKPGALADDSSLQSLAAALRGLSPKDRARLAAMLIQEQAERNDG